MSRVIGGPQDQPGATRVGHRDAGYEWGVLGGLAAAFALVSLLDVGLTFYPVGFGSAAWEFSTATAVMNNLPLGLVGIGLLAVAGIGRHVGWWVTVARWVAVALVALLLLLAVMFGRNVGEAMRSVTDPLLREGINEAIIRTAIQLAAYFVALAGLLVGTRRSQVR